VSAPKSDQSPLALDTRTLVLLATLVVVASGGGGTLGGLVGAPPCACPELRAEVQQVQADVRRLQADVSAIRAGECPPQSASVDRTPPAPIASGQ